MKARIGIYLLMALLSLWLGWRLLQGHAFNADLFSLLPASMRDQVAEQAIDRVQTEVGRHVLIVLRGEQRETVRTQAGKLIESLQQSQLFKQIRWRIDAEVSNQLFTSLQAFPASLYTEQQLSLLSGEDQGALQARLARQLFSPMAVSIADDDAFGFLSEAVMARQSQNGRIEIDDGLMRLPNAEGYALLIDLLAPENFFDFDWQRQAYQLLQKSEQQIESAGVEWRATGTLIYAAQARMQTEADIRLISTISLIGVTLLLAFGLRRFQDLCWYLSAVASSLLSATAVSLLVFGELHLITLVFGTVLIGIAGDYAIHWLFHRQVPTMANEDRHLHQSLLLAMLTTLAAFLAMLLTPFAAFQQIAVFCSAGLFGAYAFVRWGFPAAHQQLRKAVEPRWCKWLLARSAQPQPRISIILLLLAGLAIVTIPGWLQLRIDDDVRSLQQRDHQLLQDQQQIQQWLGRHTEQQFFLVQANDEQVLLQREQALQRQLESLRKQQAIDGWQALSQWVKPTEQQQQRQQLIDAAFAADGTMTQTLQALGLSEQESRQLMATMPSLKLLSVDEFLATPIGQGMQMQWLGEYDGGVASIVTLSGIHDRGAVAALQLDGVQFVDKASRISERFAEFRTTATLYVVLALALVILLLIWQRGWRAALQLWLPSVAALACAIATLGYLQLPFNLFASVGLLLVLGIGFDFALFLSETPASVYRLRAVAYSAVTNILSFGLLSFSGLPAVNVFGITVFVGVSAALLFAPSVWWWKKA